MTQKSLTGATVLIYTAIIAVTSAIPFDQSSYSHVRIQTPIGATVSPPIVGSSAPAEYLANPSLATEQPKPDSLFEKQFENIYSTPQIDDLSLPREGRKIPWDQLVHTIQMNKKMADFEDDQKNIDRSVDDSDLDTDGDGATTDFSATTDASGKSVDGDDLEKSNSFGIGIYGGGGPWGWGGGWGGGPWGGGPWGGGPWGGGPWGGGPWGGGWGGWGGGWGGWGGGWYG